MKNIMGIIFLTATLTACVPTMIVGAGTATGAAIGRDSRTLQTMSDDIDIQYQASQKLHADAITAKGSNISVDSFNRIVLLTGEVPSEAVRARAEADVQSVPKVRRVYNQLQIASLEGVLQLGDDTRISTNIKARMAFAADLNSNNFKVIVENKIVYLMGYATQAQTDIALNVIRNSSGVARVINLVEYKDNTADTQPNTEKSATPSSNNSAVVTGSVPEPLTMVPVSSGN